MYLGLAERDSEPVCMDVRIWDRVVHWSLLSMIWVAFLSLWGARQHVGHSAACVSYAFFDGGIRQAAWLPRVLVAPGPSQGAGRTPSCTLLVDIVSLSEINETGKTCWWEQGVQRAGLGL